MENQISSSQDTTTLVQSALVKADEEKTALMDFLEEQTI
jgi:hypothetical protein